MWTAALSAIPSSSGNHPENVRLTPRQTDEIVEAIADALEDAELTIDELNEAVIAATGPWAAERVVPAFSGSGSNGDAGRIMFWPQPGPQGHLHEPTPVAARIPACRWTDRPRRGRKALSVCVRTSHASAVRAVARRTAAVGDWAVRLPLR